MHPHDRRMLGQPPRDDRRGPPMPLHARGEGAQAAHQQPAFEGRELRPEIGGDRRADVADPRGAAGDHAGDHVGMPAEVLRGGMHHHVDPERDRPLQDRRGPGVVDDAHRAGGAGDRRQRAHVERLEQPRGRAFQVEELRARDRRGDGGVVAAVDIGRLDTQPPQQRLEQAEGVGIEVAHRDDAVAGRDDRKHGRGDRRHAAGRRQRVLGTFERRDLFLEEPRGRVQAARIDRPDLFPREGRPHLRHRGEGEEAGLDDRRHDGSIVRQAVVAQDKVWGHAECSTISQPAAAWGRDPRTPGRAAGPRAGIAALVAKPCMPKVTRCSSACIGNRTVSKTSVARLTEGIAFQPRAPDTCTGRRQEDSREALLQLAWDELFPAELARIVQCWLSGSTCGCTA